MRQLSPERFIKYRESTYHTRPGLRIHSETEAVEFVNQRGYIFFWPIKSDPFPSLWTAVAGDRPVADDHDDPGHVCWGWKDHLLGTGLWYYARLLRRRNTIISREYFPWFYALSPNYGDAETDYLEDYRQGRLSMDARNIYQALLINGPLNTLDLRRIARLGEKGSQNRFNKALDDLQVTMRIMPVGISNAGAWHYAFLYDIVPRQFPDLVQQAGLITENEATLQLARCFFLTQGASSYASLARLFHWNDCVSTKVINSLVEEGFLFKDVQIPNLNDNQLAITTLFEVKK
jgi:hypothetical protein